MHFPYTGGIPNNTGDFFPQALVPSRIRNSRGSATASAVPRVFTPHVPFILINKHLTCAHQPSTGSPHVARSHPNPRRHRPQRRATNYILTTPVGSPTTPAASSLELSSPPISVTHVARPPRPPSLAPRVLFINKHLTGTCAHQHQRPTHHSKRHCHWRRVGLPFLAILEHTTG